jgi:superfamily II DNA/RNA helicase
MKESEEVENEKNRFSWNPLPASSPLGVINQQILPEASLEDLPEKLRQGVENAGWPQLMPVQAKTIPYLFAQLDMMIQSQDGQREDRGLFAADFGNDQSP